jgi:hypothetical protein
MSNPRHFRIPLVALFSSVFLPLLASPARGGETSRRALLRLVPDDVAICMIVQDARETFQTVRSSALAEKFRASSLAAALRASPEAKKLADAERYFQVQLGIGWERFLDDIVGDAVVLAYWPGPPGKPQEEQGIALLRARDPRLLSELVERVRKLANPGEAEAAPKVHTHGNVSYSSWSDGKQTSYVFIDGPVLAVSHHEALVRRVIDQFQRTDNLEPAVLSRLRSLGVDQSLAAVWINARAFDAELEHQTAEAPGVDAAVRKNILEHWKVIQGIALSARVGTDEVALDVACLVHADRLPNPIKRFFTPGRASELWNCFPENAMLAMAGRVDAVALTEMAGHFLDDKSRVNVRIALDRYAKGSLGRDVEREVFPFLGPDWGFCVVAPPDEEKAWLPYLIGALKVQPGEKDPPLDRTIASFLNGMAMFAVVAHNSTQTEPMTLHTEMQDKIEVKFFVNDKHFPVGFRPAFAMKDGYLVVASSPAAIRMFHGAKSRPEAVLKNGEVPYVRISPTAIQTFLAERGKALVDHLAAKDQIPLEEAEKRVQALGEVLGLLENVEVTQRTSADQVHLTLRIRTSAPLRK